MSMTQADSVLKSEIQQKLAEAEASLHASFQERRAIHEVEGDVWNRLLDLGRLLIKEFLALHGTGDLGETITLDGQECQRLPELHRRRYVSIFGEFWLARAVYGTREGQKIEFVPLDNRLQLPQGSFSFLLQDWDQALCVEQAFAQVNVTIARMLRLNQTVGSLEHMNQEMAEGASTYLINRPLPAAKDEGEIFVGTADGKGIVMRRDPETAPPPAHRTKGEKASQKRMATVGGVYSVDRHVRTPEDIVAALFHDKPEKSKDRPRPQHKQLWASLPQDDGSLSGMEAVFTWMDWELRMRNPDQKKETVYVCDGQEALWDAVRDQLPGTNAVEVLDLLHVTPRLWKAAHVFHAEKSKEAETFVRVRLLRVLQGKGKDVVRGLRQMGTKRKLTSTKKKTLGEICGYLKKNMTRMRYDEYLAAGYPIASGVIEGACRHLVKDRMERAGMHWTAKGAQAMLDLRSVFICGQWEEYHRHRITLETQRLYPHREAAEPAYCMAP
jgi:hypothetical protein